MDRYGYCVNCGKCLVVDEYIDEKIQKRFLPDHDEYEYELNDDTKMRVCMCKECKSNIDKVDTVKVMKSVVEGWKDEMDNRLNWDDNKKKKYMDRYSKLKIKNKKDNLTIKKEK